MSRERRPHPVPQQPPTQGGSVARPAPAKTAPAEASCGTCRHCHALASAPAPLPESTSLGECRRHPPACPKLLTVAGPVMGYGLVGLTAPPCGEYSPKTA